ncbi:MAG TPA: DUF2461 domain-containing protein [Alphaproteobacteria bacterium]|nr:DUF2461 domain-containing protein [Alphaproteobacteria bacterium]
MIFPGFSPDALLFLRSLKRNNRREWFQPRKEKYQALIREPMLELVSGLNEAFARFAPAYIRPPQKAALRIYRDARFSQDKTPYKTHVAAIFPRNTADGMRGACLYFHFNDKELSVRGGAYWPERDELLAYRTLPSTITRNSRKFCGTRVCCEHSADFKANSSPACRKASPRTIPRKPSCAIASGIWETTWTSGCSPPPGFCLS